VAWFRRRKDGDEDRPKKVVIAEGLWVKCDSCREIVYRAEVDRAGRVCPKCGYPFRISARERIVSLVDEGSFEEREAGMRSKDPLGFKDTKRYTDRIKAARAKATVGEISSALEKAWGRYAAESRAVNKRNHRLR